MSNYVVIARFDNETNERFLRLGDELKKSGYSVPEWPPHITISAYENIDESLICGWTSAFSESHHKIRIGMYSIGILPSEGNLPTRLYYVLLIALEQG